MSMNKNIFFAFLFIDIRVFSLWKNYLKEKEIKVFLFIDIRVYSLWKNYLKEKEECFIH